MIVTSQTQGVKDRIVSRISGVEGVLAVAFRDLGTGEEILVNERELFHAASTMKTPVMIELFRQAEAGIINLEDSITVKNTFSSIVDGSPYSMDLGEDSDDSMYGMIGSRMTIRQLMYQMITVSSNLATNILIEIADARKVTATMRSFGADSIQVLRGVEDGKAFDAGLNNRTNAYDLMLIFSAIAEGKAAGRKACEEMIDILDDQKFRDLLPSRLPPDVRIAHKTGSITGVEHDGGIVYLPGGRRYVLVVLSRGLKDREQGKKAIGDISKVVYDYMMGR
jgi:beta-lactamase class A